MSNNIGLIILVYIWWKGKGRRAVVTGNNMGIIGAGEMDIWTGLYIFKPESVLLLLHIA